MLQCFAKEDQPAYAHDYGDVNAVQAVLRRVRAAVALHVASGDEVVEPVAPELGRDGADHRGEMDHGQRDVREAVAAGLDRWKHELRDCRHEADRPHGEGHDEERG